MPTRAYSVPCARSIVGVTLAWDSDLFPINCGVFAPLLTISLVKHLQFSQTHTHTDTHSHRHTCISCAKSSVRSHTSSPSSSGGAFHFCERYVHVNISMHERAYGASQIAMHTVCVCSRVPLLYRARNATDTHARVICRACIYCVRVYIMCIHHIYNRNQRACAYCSVYSGRLCACMCANGWNTYVRVCISVWKATVPTCCQHQLAGPI